MSNSCISKIIKLRLKLAKSRHRHLPEASITSPGVRSPAFHAQQVDRLLVSLAPFAVYLGVEGQG